MKINRIVICENTRLLLNDIKKIDWDVSGSYIQVITGRNGSGKSTIMEMFNPLPYVVDDYTKDGYEEKYITSKLGNNYILSSGKVGHNKHSFVLVDEGELNPGGTRTVQLDLIKEHFDLSPNDVSIVNGHKTFIDMSVNDRKKWFMQLSGFDFDYAMNIFEKIKSAFNDRRIELKQTSLKNTSLEKRLEDDELLDKELKNIDNELSNLTFTEVASITNSTFDESAFKKLMYDMAGIKFEGNHYWYHNEITMLNSRIKEANDIIEYYKGRITKLNESKANFGISDKIKSTKETYAELKGGVSHLSYRALKTLLSNIDIFIPSKVVFNAEALSVTIKDIRDKLAKNKKDRELIESEIREKSGEISKLKKTLSGICVKCGYDNDNEIIKRETNEKLIGLGKLKDTSNALENTRRSLDMELEKAETNSNTFVTLLASVKRTLGDNDIETIEPSKIKERVNNLLFKFDELSRLSSEILFLEDKAKSLLMDTDINKTILKYEDIVSEATMIHSTYKISREIYMEHIKNVDKLSNLKNDILEHKELRKSNMVKIYNQFKSYESEKKREELMSIRDDINRRINSNKFIRDEMSINSSKIEQLNTEIDDLNILKKAISPDGGLIGKVMSNFMDAFLGRMNSVISRIWDYDLMVLPPEIKANGKFEYRFPVRIGDKGISKDVLKTSTSIGDIINLAFRISSMETLGLEELPLLIDEFGKSMDEIHRDKVYDEIERITDLKFSNLVIISHYEELYNRFTTADINSLSDMMGLYSVDGNKSNFVIEYY